jgi:predicted metal-dependent hydrolase
MPTLQIGRKDIPYELRRSATAAERRIIVTPDRVEVTALVSDNDDDIAGFLNRKRQWLFNTVRKMERIDSARHTVPRFMTGSKIPYRGRRMPLTVRRTDAERISITYRNGFLVDLPHWAGDASERLVAAELKLWLKQRARKEVQAIASSYIKRHGLAPRSVRVGEMAQGWGSCGPEGNVLINWHLILAPAKVLEYVTVHELAHLIHRSHGPEFWQGLAALYPGYEAPKAWLEANEAMLSAAFLDVR